MSPPPSTISQRIFALLHNDAFKMLSQVPGPAPAFPFGNALAFTKSEPHHLMSRWHAEYGDYMVFWIFGQPSLLINDPKLLEQILVKREDDFYKNVPRAAMRPIMGQALFASPGGDDARWKRKHHHFNSPEVRQWYDRVLRLPGPVLDITMAERLPRVPTAGVTIDLDLFDLMLHTSVQLFARAVLGTGLSESQFDDFTTLWREMGKRGALPVPFSPDPRFWYRRHRWLSFVSQRIERDPSPTAIDIAARMHGSTLPRRYVRDEVSTVFFAGARNVAIAAAMVLYTLSTHPEIGKRVRKEITDAAPTGTLDLKTLEGLEYLDRAVKETMRLYSVVPGFAREVKPDRSIVLGGRVLPPKTQIFVVPWTLHRHPGLWPEPMKFDPDRFLEPPAPAHYIPFGYGAGTCIGADFTLVCTKGLVATTLARYALQIDARGEADLAMHSATAYPRYGIAARLGLREAVTRRSDASESAVPAAHRA